MTRPNPAAPAPVLPLRQIGLYAATCITVGNIIGSGIFRSPHTVGQHLDSLTLVLAAWILGGALSLCGSLVLAELAVARPKTGGLYVFIREGFGDAFGFVFGWANLWVIKPTLIASVTSVFALYFCQAAGLPGAAALPVGIAAILLLTFVNWLGVREGVRTQTLFTTLKVLGIAALCVCAFTLPHTGPGEDALRAVAEAGPNTGHPSLLLGLVLAMIPILFAYDGWTDSTYVAGEIKDPRRALPFSILGGTVLVIGVYVLTNLAYYTVLSPAEVAAIEPVGSETIGRILGTWGQQALAVLVAVSTFGTANGSILTGPRVTPGDGRRRPALEAAGRTRPQARHARPGAVAAGGAVVRVAVGVRELRGCLGLVRDDVLAVLRADDGCALPPARARREARGPPPLGLPHLAVPGHAGAVHPGDGGADRQRPARPGLACGGGRVDRGAGVAGVPGVLAAARRREVGSGVLTPGSDREQPVVQRLASPRTPACSGRGLLLVRKRIHKRCLVGLCPAWG
jgi:APA family basic amino acid/polyamine antiporter